MPIELKGFALNIERNLPKELLRRTSARLLLTYIKQQGPGKKRRTLAHHHNALHLPKKIYDTRISKLVRRGSNNHKQKIIEKTTWILVVQSVLNLSNLIVLFPQQSVVMFFILNVLHFGFKMHKIIAQSADSFVKIMILSKHILTWKPRQQL